MKLITIPEEEIHKAIANEFEFIWGDIEPVENYKADDWDNDHIFATVFDAVAALVRAHPANGDDSVSYSFVGNVEGVVGGYEFQYVVHSGNYQPLRLVSMYIEWRDLKPDMNGMDGLVMVANTVIALLNDAIRGLNDYLSGLVLHGQVPSNVCPKCGTFLHPTGQCPNKDNCDWSEE